MPSKQRYYLAAAHPTGGHVTRLEHHSRGRHVIIGAGCSSADTNELDKVAGIVVNSAIALAAARDIQKVTEGGGRVDT